MYCEQNFANEKESGEKIREFIEKHCSDNCVSPAKATKISICADEIVSIIIRYSRAHLITVTISGSDSTVVTIAFADDGIPFNPLKETKDFDSTVPPEERPVGGMGVFLVKKMMKEVTYRREKDTNIFTIAI